METIHDNDRDIIKSQCVHILIIALLSIIFILYTMSYQRISKRPNNQFGVWNNNLNFTISRKHKIKCLVYTGASSGGRLGNWMFKIASAYGLARLHSCHLHIADVLFQMMSVNFVFNVSSLHISSSEFNSILQNKTSTIKTIKMDVTCEFRADLTRPKAVPAGTILELQGYWQSYLHFLKYSEDLREHVFVAKQSALQKVSQLFVRIYRQKSKSEHSFSALSYQSFKRQLAQSILVTWIGIHIRRTDFRYFKYSSSDEYVFKAMNYYSSKYSNSQFIVASDDKSYCKRIFKRHKNVFVTPRSFVPSEDMIALSLCQHSIVTGGTFGWWSAFLANGEVIHDTVYPSGCERREHYYPPWFLIDGNLRAFRNSSYSL